MKILVGLTLLIQMAGLIYYYKKTEYWKASATFCHEVNVLIECRKAGRSDCDGIVTRLPFLDF